MPVLKLKLVRVANAVPFDGPSTQTLRCEHGTLEFDTETNMVVATPKKQTGTSKQTIIPTGNILFMEVLDEERQRRIEEQRNAVKNAPKTPAPPPKDDTYRPTKPDFK